MAEEKYTIPAEPVYSGDIRKLQDSDPASATTTFNPLIQRLIENTHAVKMQVESLTEGGSAPWLPTKGGVVNGVLGIGNSADSSAVYLSGVQTELEGDATLFFEGCYLGAPVRLTGIANPQYYSDAVNKDYVDNLFSQVAPILVKVEISGQQGMNETKYVKCYPVEENTFSINFSVLNRVGIGYTVRMYPPDGYAFTGLYESSGVNMFNDKSGAVYDGMLSGDGSYIEFVNHSGFFEGPLFRIVGSFTLEVA